MQIENIVLYKRNGMDERQKIRRHPLFSTDTSDQNAPAKIVAKMATEYRNAEISGAVCELDLILQSTEVDKDTGKVLTDTEYTLLNPVTLTPVGKPQRSLEGIL